MGIWNRIRNFATGRGFVDSVPAPAAREPELVERRGGLGGFIDRLTGADVRREEAARQAQQEQQRAEQARQEQERQRAEQERRELERQREELTRAREELERQRAEQERQREELANRQRELEQQRAEQARQEAEREQERQREEAARQEAERERQREEAARQQVAREQAEREWRKDLGIEREVTGGKGWTIYTVRTPEEVRERLQDAADAGKRAGLSVHDANGWHHLYTNPGRGHFDDRAGQNVGGGAGMTASEMLDRLERYGYPGQGEGISGASPEPGTELPPGDDVLTGPEWDYEGAAGEYDGDYYDYVDESDGGDEGDTEPYDPASVNGYQVIVYN